MGPALRRWKRALIMMATTLVVASIPATAQAAVATSCSFDAGTATVTATIGSGASVTLERSGDAVTFGGAACGAADVTNADQINVTAPDDATSEALTISIAGGAFAPGKTAEGDGNDELEITVDVGDTDALTFDGSSSGDMIHDDLNQVDLLAGTPGEGEITFLSSFLAPVFINGNGGADDLRLRYYAGGIDGGPGNDSLAPELYQPSAYDGGNGDDVLTYDDPGGAIFEATSPSAYDIHRSDGEVDTAVGIETLAGGDQADHFLGSSAADRFIGKGGKDTFLPRGGDDVIEGGTDFDTLSMEESPTPVDVDVSAGTAVGEGSDTFSRIEIIRATPQADTFSGDPLSAGVIWLDGYGGHDVLDMSAAAHGQAVDVTPSFPNSPPSWVRLIAQHIRIVRGSSSHDRIEIGNVDGTELRARFFGLGGNDRLVGGAHHDVLYGGGGDDRLNGQGGRDICDGGPGTDDVVNCEV